MKATDDVQKSNEYRDKEEYANAGGPAAWVLVLCFIALIAAGAIILGLM